MFIYQTTDESYPDLESDIVETEIPQVETSLVVFEDKPPEENVTIGT